jgi:catechol 2,3-dioxygenase-like lactoylglutathione lyase family enzyme
VEHTSPKIGDHEPNEVTRARRQQLRRQPALGVATIEGEDLPTASVRSVIIERAEQDFSWDRAEYPMVEVTDIAGAERFYTDILGLGLIARLKRDPRGDWRELPHVPDRPEANYHTSEADRVLLEHGPLRLALARKGHGARLEYAKVLTHFSVLVESSVLSRLKATALVRGYDVLEDTADDFTFRDPYGVAWSVTDKSSDVDF